MQNTGDLPSYAGVDLWCCGVRRTPSRWYSSFFVITRSGAVIPRRYAMAIAAMPIVFAPSFAIAAPPDLMNKSITVSYTVTIPAKAQDGTMTPGVRHVTRIFYISSAGRVFGRVSRRDGPYYETKNRAPGEAGNTMHFEGVKLVGVMSFVSGAAQMTITFGEGGQSCDASFKIGRESGRTLRWKGVDGNMYEAIGPAAVSNVSCSISAGNAFSGQ